VPRTASPAEQRATGKAEERAVPRTASPAEQRATGKAEPAPERPDRPEQETTMTDTTDPLAALVAKQAITEVLYQYCRAMDLNDLELGASVWHPDGTAHYEGMFEGTGRGFVAFGQEGHRSAFDGTSHQVTNIMIELDGDRATSESYVTAANRILGGDKVYVIRGRYQDRWSRRGGEWRIDHRHFVTDIWQVLDEQHDAMPGMA
jgi:hypothetical protein